VCPLPWSQMTPARVCRFDTTQKCFPLPSAMLALCVDLFGCQSNDPGCSCTMRALHAPAAQLVANVGHCPQRHAALLCMLQAACAPCLTGCSWHKLLAITIRRDRIISKERHLLKCELHSFPQHSDCHSLSLIF